MMDNFLEFVKSSREFLKNCLELCDSLESDILSDSLSEETKDEKLIQMKNRISKVKKNINTVRETRIKPKVIYNGKETNGDHLSEGDDNEVILTNIGDQTTVIANDISEEPGDTEMNDQNRAAKNAILADSDNDSLLDCSVDDKETSTPIKECFVILQNSGSLGDSITNNIMEDSFEEIDRKLVIVEGLGAGNDVVGACSDVNIDTIVDDHETKAKDDSDRNETSGDTKKTESLGDISDDQNNPDITDPVVNDMDPTLTDCDTLPKMMECSIVLEDLAKCPKDHILYKDYMEELEKEIKKLSQIPKFTNKKKHRNEEENDKQKKSDKETIKRKSTRIIESDSEDNTDDSDSVEIIDHSDDNDITNIVIADTPVNTTDSDSSSKSSKKDYKSHHNTNYFRKQNLIQRRITRSLKIPIMSDSESSIGKLPKKIKKTSNHKSIVCLSSTSEDESDASASDLRKSKDNKRKKSTSSRTQNKKQKLDPDATKEDSDDIETRKNIRKIFTQSKLSDATKIAEQFEMERRKRMEEKQEMYNKSMANKATSADDSVSELILEKDQNGDSIVEVHEHIAKKLKMHQIEAVNFMYDCVIESVACLQKSQEEKGDEDKTASSIGGCILAHCMGLGKTLALIAFMHTMLTTPILNMYSCIVVCPVNTALNWKKEWDMWMPADRPLKLFELCTNDTKRNKISIVQDWYKKGGILIIGYEMFRLLATGDSRTMRNKTVQKKMFEALVDPGPDFIVCDEGHLLKNAKSAISKVINKIKTKRRLVLTGTPLQNKLIEYHTMVNFVKPNLLGTHKEFLNRFVNPISNGQHINSTPYDVNIMKKRSHILNKTLDGCVHRRDYSALVKYLPPKYEYVIKIRMSTVQMKLYKAYLSTTRINKQRLFQDQTSLARIMTHPFVVCMHQEIQDKKIFLADTDEDSFFTDGSDEEDKKTLSKKPNNDDNNTINLVSDESDDINKSEKEEKMEVDSNKKKKENDAIDSDSSVEEVIRNWSTSTRTRKQNKLNDSDDEPKVNFELENLKETPTDTYWWSEIIQPEHEHQIEISGKLTILFQILRKADEMGDKVIIFSQSLLVLDIIEKYLYELHTISQKVNEDLQKLSDTINPTNNEETNEMSDRTKKSSEFFSDIGYNSWEKGIDYDRMDGSTQVFTRADIQSRFNSEKDKRLRLFLISTRAGGMGVNLIAANRVVIFDVSWNPSHDIQAIFRSYRFGQHKPVYVYRLVGQATMEEKMYERQVTKLSLSLRVIDEQQISRYFTEEDLKSLYKYEPDIFDPDNKERETPILPKDRFLAEMIQEFPQWIYGYHEHDSLLQNKDEEELTENERQEAWKEFEDEKKHGMRPMINQPQVGIDPNQFARVQMSQMQKLHPQYAAIYAQNYVNLLRYALTQEPDLKYNPSQLSNRMQAIFFVSLQKYKDANSGSAITAVVASGGTGAVVSDKGTEVATTHHDKTAAV